MTTAPRTFRPAFDAPPPGTRVLVVIGGNLVCRGVVEYRTREVVAVRWRGILNEFPGDCCKALRG